jgi:hypothetical protein
MRGPTIPAAVLGSMVAVLVAAVPASASQSSPVASARLTPAATPAGARVDVDLKVQRFIQRGSRTQAAGVVTATLSGAGAKPTTVRQRVLLQVRPGATCQILLLTLNELDLTLLGVTIHLEPVRLQITGRRAGGILGRLFCSLAGTRLTSARAATVASLNRGLRGHPVHPMRFTVPTGRAAQAPAAGTCSILDLVIGPLHLDLLGLVVDLNRVHLTITGNPAGGLLGRLLCGVASAPTPAVPAVPAVPVPAVPGVTG